MSVTNQTAANASTLLSLSNKSSVIEVSFKKEKFSEAPDQCIDLTLGDFYICANNPSLTNDESSQLVVSSFEGGALELYLKGINPLMHSQKIVDKLRARYNTPQRKLSLQLEVDSLSLRSLWSVIRYKMTKNVYVGWLNILTISHHNLWMASKLNLIR